MAALFILCILTGYLAGNILQPKLEAASMGLTLINYSNYKTLFVLFQLSWGLWLAALFWKERKGVFIYIISISFFFYGSVQRFVYERKYSGIVYVVCTCYEADIE